MPTVNLNSGGKDVCIFYDVYGSHENKAAEAEIGNAVNTQRKESTVPSGTAPSHPVRNDDVKTSSPEIDLDRASSPENDVYNVEDPSLTITALGQNPPARGKDGKFNSSSANYRAKRRSSSPHIVDSPSRCVLIIAGLGARGRTEFFQHIIAHFASLKDATGEDLLSVCTYDSRGIGGSTTPQKLGQYSTKLMAEDALGLLDHLGWKQAHIIGLSLGGMVACKLAAMQPARIASLSCIATTSSGWHMLAGISSRPFSAYLAGSGPLKWKIPANLKYNFSKEYLEEVVDGKKTRMEVLIENTHKAIEEHDSGKFLAEGQSNIGRKGHLAAVFKHRMHQWELKAIREASFPCQVFISLRSFYSEATIDILVIVGRHDRLARSNFVSRLASELRASLLVVEAGHAGILIEAPQAIVPALETFLIGNAQTDVLRIAQMRSATNEQVLQDRLFAKEFLSSFGPGRVSFKHSSSGDLSSKAYARSKSAAT